MKRLSIGNNALRLSQDNTPLFRGKAKNQKFRHKRRDLPWPKIDDTHHLFAYQCFRCIIMGNLCRSLFYTNSIPKINPHLLRRLARFGENFGLYDRPRKNLYFFEIFVFNDIHNLLTNER